MAHGEIDLDHGFPASGKPAFAARPSGHPAEAQLCRDTRGNIWGRSIEIKRGNAQSLASDEQP